MLDDYERKALVADFMSWKRGPLSVALKLAEKHGILLSGVKYSDGTKG